MKKLINSPDSVVAESLEGMAAAYAGRIYCHFDPTFVCRADAPVPGKVAIVSGGGSGHEPMHAGFVGRGMLDAACPGQVFTSPTPDQIREAMRAVHGGKGVLNIVKNYSGDVMNFEMAAELAHAEGIPIANILIDDDTAVKDSLYTQGRRGVGTTVLAEKICGAAAEKGYDLNRLLERELRARTLLAERQAERREIDAAEIPISERARRRQQVLGKEIAELSLTGPLYDPERFKHLALSPYLADFIKENPQGDTRIRLNRLLLEAAYPNALARSRAGVYPDREIRLPTTADAMRCTQQYVTDARRRAQLNQLEPGESIIELPDGRVQLVGQATVMIVNGLLTKVIFDQNPTSQFYVEESMAIKWMYPYLTPFGIILNLNRQPQRAIWEMHDGENPGFVDQKGEIEELKGLIKKS
jgi:hypothetical protein